MITFSVEIALGIALQAAAMLLVCGFVRRPWIGNTGFLFLVMAVLYHGVTEIAQALFPGHNFYRLLISQSELNHSVMILSSGILVFAVTYVFVSRIRISRFSPLRNSYVPPQWRLPPWQFMLAVAAPLYFATLIGQRNSAMGYWLTGLSDQFLMLTLAMATLVFLIHFRGRFLLVVMPLQIALLVLIGQRATVAVALVMVLSALARSRIRIKPGQAAVLIGVLVAGVLSISLTRLVAGREAFQEATLASRLGAVTSSLQDLFAGKQSDTGRGILDDFVYRFDGNAFPALISGALDAGIAPAGFGTIANNMALVIPQFLNPVKLQSTLESRDEEYFTVYHYGLPGADLSPPIDYLPTTLTMFYSYYGLVIYLILVPLAGTAFAVIDKWLWQRNDLVRVTVGLALTYCVLYFEQGTTVYFVVFRGVLIFVFVIFALNRFRMIVSQLLYRKTQAHPIV